MDTVMDMISRGVEQLVQRADGPLQFRLIVMPTVVTLVAIRAGLQDARQGQPAFLWGILARPFERRQRLVAAWKDISRIFAMAVVMDVVYQLLVLRTFYVVQTLIVAVVCAIVPYMLFRGPANRLARGLSAMQGCNAAPGLSGKTPEGKEGLQESPDFSDE